MLAKDVQIGDFIVVNRTPERILKAEVKEKRLYDKSAEHKSRIFHSNSCKGVHLNSSCYHEYDELDVQIGKY